MWLREKPQAEPRSRRRLKALCRHHMDAPPPPPPLIKLQCGLTSHDPYYSLRAFEGTRSRSPNATLADLRLDYIDYHQKACGCDAQIGSRIYLANVDYPKESFVTFGTENFEECTGDTRLATLAHHFDLKNPARLNLLIESVASPKPKRTYRPYRSPHSTV